MLSDQFFKLNNFFQICARIQLFKACFALTSLACMGAGTGTYTKIPVPVRPQISVPDPAGSEPFGWIRIRSNFPDPDPTLKSQKTKK